MRAALFDRYGPPEVLYVGTVPKPAPAPGEVLVRVHAASLNGGELHGRAGRVRPVTELMQRGWPKRMGLDFTGEVVALGAGATGPKVGDRVWGVLGRTFGSNAEYVAVRPRRLSLAPAGLDLVEAAALPVGTTAITALRDKARLRPGERLLVRGASGGVGVVAVQLGKALGAHVTALAGPRNLDLVRDLGADEAYDYATTAPADLGRFDVVMDTVGTDHPAYRRLLTPSGRMVAIAFDLGRPAASLAYIAASAVHGGRRVRAFSGDPSHRLFADLARYVERGDLRPVVDTVFPLEEVAEAHRALEAGGVRGKIVLRIA
ncbi:Quinone oxidoreductase [[Actinomadura] parvosata subsp. kistnae]|uniref:NAD(P)-dependent alcohol dehydrogenase n=2 Tax=Nonomuraea TaxID=83681 RepID=A0A1V0A272_9ACTN|nr:NAD(P)-dependent alcohol dehydrogenase [Nonomuraea sp. ATCC 55076]SPL89043.1 Quinone oxidoreductase [Actinomadura parvosata subsp. kistnae]